MRTRLNKQKIPAALYRARRAQYAAEQRLVAEAIALHARSEALPASLTTLVQDLIVKQAAARA